MIIVLDTNVLVSGILKSKSDSGTIVRLVTHGFIQLAYDARIITEYQEVLKRPKFGWSHQDVEALIIQIKDKGVLVSGAFISKEILPDPDDKPFLEVAMSTKERILITGNKKHFPQEACEGVTVISPSEFVEIYKERL